MTNLLRTIGSILLCYVVASLGFHAQAQNTISGIVTKVRDGDTIEVTRTPIRLNGLHAPELRQRDGLSAKRFMVRLVLNKRVTCRLNGERTYDRLVGTCFLNGKDIARSLIRVGLGRDCPRYSGGRYAADEPPSVKTMRLPKYCTRK